MGFPATDRHVAQMAAVDPHARWVQASDTSLAADLLDATVFCGHAKVPVDWDAVARRGKLKWIQSTAAGLDHCLVAPVVASPIVVTSASGVFADQVAEQAMALLLGLLRGLPIFFRARTTKTFRRQPTDDLHGKTVGIVGFGGNGRRIAEVLAPFRCRLIATDHFVESVGSPPVSVWPASALDRLLREADIVILTLPLTAETRGLLDARAISLMKPTAYLINVGRGATVVEDALCEALQSGRLAGAGLDVFEREPLPPDSPLWELEQVVMTPHVGAQSARRLDDVTELFCRNLSRWMRGEPLWNVVDKTLGFPVPHARLPANWRSG